MQQTTNTILMVRPASFRMNEQTAVNNYYQQELSGMLPASINAKAQEEFDAFVEKLRAVGVEVVVIEDTKEPDTPDALFPNNWISFHENGDVAIYPMFAENRRLERREDVLEILEEKGFSIENVIDYSEAEEEEIFLEGTGSMILDRQNRKAYCALSPRADEELFIEFCEDFEFTPVIFEANQTVEGQREAIYHTNVMMCVAETFAVVCLDSIDDKKEKKNLLKHLKSDKKEVIAISEEQVTQFAGNMLQVRGNNNERYLVMSTSAYESLTNQQLKNLEKHTKILHSSLQTIETCGGGSARCMMAEVFLPKN
ncbi:citrulline utilization hydrolase CtlX [Tenacibaculum aestuarii]|uniref:citrulline utilization hydrolase CtlX n=1 Tax=Tenacibaculum aestuarii TaxID=362781 RepID=UPI0038B55C03